MLNHQHNATRTLQDGCPARYPLLLCAMCCVLCAVVGCAHVPPHASLPSPKPLPAELQAYYADLDKPQAVTRQLVAEHDTYRQWLIRFPLSVEGFTPTEPVVEFDWFESARPGRRAAILVNPILGGDYPLERDICQDFARHGFHVALIHRKTLKVSPEHPVDHVELLLRQGIVRIRQVVDWMAAHERVDSDRMGSFGISMGGIASVITAAVEPRLRCHVVSLAGGSIADILISSPDRLLAKPRQQYLARNHLTRDALADALRDAIKTDPVLLAPYVDARHVLMVIGLFDHTIGRRHALRLWRALGRPEAVFVPLGHYTAYLILPYLKFRSLRFFHTHLERPSSEPRASKTAAGAL